MLEQLLELLKIAGILLLFTAIWLISIAIVFRDINRRNLHGIEQFLWLAAVALLPLVGFLIYWVARFLTRLLLPDSRSASFNQEDPRLRMTEVKPPPEAPRRMPTIAAQETPTHTVPVLDPWDASATSKGLPSRKFTLVALDGPYTGSKFPLSSLPARIGRGSSASIQLNADQGISRQHAELYPEPAGGVRLRDLNSTHGTFVNGQRVIDTRLTPGDKISVGLSTLLFTDIQG